MSHPREWMSVRPEGLYCSPGDFHVDPVRAVARAVITHGHSDHARPGHGEVIAMAETLAIMGVRYGSGFCARRTPLDYGGVMDIGQAKLSFAPAGHILGSAQAVIAHDGGRIVVSGDYKRRPDPTARAFEAVACDVFVTEATFALPVFRQPSVDAELVKLLTSLELFKDRCHLVGVYSLGKCQRVMMELRRLGYAKPFFVHGALVKMCELYEDLGYRLGEIVPVASVDKASLAGEIVLTPPSALSDRWSRNLPNVLTVMASGWMQIRARARQRMVELPLVISDHADWDELIATLKDVGAPEVWITHGREDALTYIAEKLGYRARALSLLGFEEEDGE